MFCPRLTRIALVGCILSVGLLVGRPSMEYARPTPRDDDEIARLIAQLGSASFAKRESASRALSQQGEKVLAGLRRVAADSPDPEVRRRASKLAQAIAWDLHGGEECSLLHDGTPSGLAIAADGSSFLSTSGCSLFRWDLNASPPTGRLTGRGAAPVAGMPSTGVALSSDGRQALTVAGSEMYWWDLKTGRELHSFSLRKPAWFRAVAFAASGKEALTADTDGIKLWDLSSGRLMEDRRPHQTELGCAACDREGRRILTSGVGDGIICLTDLRDSGGCRRLDAGDYRWVLSAALSPNGQRALIGTTNARFDQGQLSFWDLDTGTLIRRLGNGPGPISAVSFSADGASALTGGLDGSVRLWDLAAGREVGSFTDHTARVGCVAFSPDGRTGFTGGWDGFLRVWKLPRLDRKD